MVRYLRAAVVALACLLAACSSDNVREGIDVPELPGLVLSEQVRQQQEFGMNFMGGGGQQVVAVYLREGDPWLAEQTGSPECLVMVVYAPEANFFPLGILNMHFVEEDFMGRWTTRLERDELGGLNDVFDGREMENCIQTGPGQSCRLGYLDGEHPVGLSRTIMPIRDTDEVNAHSMLYLLVHGKVLGVVGQVTPSAFADPWNSLVDMTLQVARGLEEAN